MPKKEIDKEIADRFASLNQLICEKKEPGFSVRNFRKIARLSRQLAIMIRINLEDFPWLESWWQEYRLEKGLHDIPTLYMFVKKLDALAEFFDWMADGVIKERKRAAKRKA